VQPTSESRSPYCSSSATWHAISTGRCRPRRVLIVVPFSKKCRLPYPQRDASMVYDRAIPSSLRATTRAVDAFAGLIENLQWLSEKNEHDRDSSNGKM
jgi:hypothetical protein